MRIKKISASGIEPVKKFEVDDLSDLVVLAGPNGVGKTRLVSGLLAYFQSLNGENPSFVVEATDKSERDLWGKSSLSTATLEDAEKLRALLHQNRRRRNFKSNIIYYESNRSIQKIKPLAFQFDFPDPWEENVSWNSTYSGLATRWQDTQHAIFKKIQNQKTAIANRAIQLRSSGFDQMNLEFSDPLDPFRDAFTKLLAPKKLESVDVQGQRLMYSENGEHRAVETLSSGEREVLNITFDFILRKPSHCVIFFDEPELHLHPELLSRLITTLRTVGESNQFILISHSPEVIGSSLDDTVVFITPPRDESENQAVVLDSDSGATEVLHRLGQSIGVISLGRKIVLIEGTESSLDNKTYLHILDNRFPGLVLLPSGGKGNLLSFGKVAEEVLDKTLWGIRFFMLADRDASPSSPITTETSNFRALGKYHLENYFLDANVLAACFASLEEADSWLRSADQIEVKLREIAREQLSFAASLVVSKRIRDAIGNIDAMPKSIAGKNQKEFSDLFVDKGKAELERVCEGLESSEIGGLSDAVYGELEALLDQPGHDWKREYPGKQVFAKFCGAANMKAS